MRSTGTTQEQRGGTATQISQVPNAIVPSTCGGNWKIRIKCHDGYVRKAGTSNQFNCTEQDGKLQLKSALPLQCIPNPNLPLKKVTLKEVATTKTTTTNQPVEEFVNTTSKISTPIFITSISTQDMTTTTTPTQSDPYTTTTGVNISPETSVTSSDFPTATTICAEPNSKKPNYVSGSETTTGVTAGVIVLVCLIATAVAAVLWRRSRHRATNIGNEVQLDNCTYYVPVPVSEQCSAEPGTNADDAANTSTE